MDKEFVCPLCGNKNPKYLGLRNNKPYCRKCISFIGEKVDEDFPLPSCDSQAFIPYILSKDQQRVSMEILKNYQEHLNTLIYAVCGAGKTELVFSLIEFGLKNQLKIGFAIPRRDVVMELTNRLKRTFKNNLVVAVYGGNNKLLNGDIICLTTHQLYRYEKFFDILILDEIDAFPYKDNEVLESLFKRSLKGNYVMMSATPSEKRLQEFKNGRNRVVTLFTRYHKKSTPVPRNIQLPRTLQFIYLIYKVKQFKKEKKPVFVFVPTILEAENLYSFLKYFIKNGNYVHSLKKDRTTIIEDFRNAKYSYLITTSVLERGVTLKNLQVIIFNADHELYSKESLLQISGRVGRVKGAENGESIYLSFEKTEAIKGAIDFTKRANSYL